MNRDQEKAMFASQGKRGKGLSKSSLSPTTKSTIGIITGRRFKEKFVNINKENVNEVESDEIALGVLTDGEFYRKVINPNANNIAKRMLRNDFQKEYLFTKKSFLETLAREAIERYEKMYGSPGSPMHFNSDTKMMIGRNVAEKIFDVARDIVRIDASDKRKFLVATKTGHRDEYVNSNNNIETAMSSF
ncbi:MAG: hypothetical protein KGI08_11220 [Thaumarchaeota archaeon]|nr:hypothetical protein [Nitrososphaerota archaeon]